MAVGFFKLDFYWRKLDVADRGVCLKFWKCGRLCFWWEFSLCEKAHFERRPKTQNAQKDRVWFGLKFEFLNTYYTRKI